ncbi:MAG: hypothetical protein L3K06_06885, partial [Thermoplasmata archaeon]|nr:hypothetical protein [Thermoplasmata archaeon]
MEFGVYRIASREQLARYMRPLRALAGEILESAGAPEFTVEDVLRDVISHVDDWPMAGIWIALRGHELIALGSARLFTDRDVPLAMWTWAWSEHQPAGAAIMQLAESWAAAKGARGVRIT